MLRAPCSATADRHRQAPNGQRSACLKTRHISHSPAGRLSSLFCLSPVINCINSRVEYSSTVLESRGRALFIVRCVVMGGQTHSHSLFTVLAGRPAGRTAKKSLQSCIASLLVVPSAGSLPRLKSTFKTYCRSNSRFYNLIKYS